MMNMLNRVVIPFQFMWSLCKSLSGPFCYSLGCPPAFSVTAHDGCNSDGVLSLQSQLASIRDGRYS